MANPSISSVDFLKSYGRVVETALREPVTITSHGRERLVLMSADEFRRLKQKDRQALNPWERDEADLRALEVSEAATEESAFDRDGLVRELAAATGEGLTEAVRRAVEERLLRVRRDRGRGGLKEDLLAIGAHCAALPEIDDRAPDVILGYDEHGLPR